MAIQTDLPSADSPNLVLVKPTLAEMVEMWNLSAKTWGNALTTEEYVERESYLANIPPTQDGGVSHWILTDSSCEPNARPILSSCESLRRRVFVCFPDGEVKEEITHGIGSVFSNPAYRGRGYASRMLLLLGRVLNTWQKDVGDTTFSILFSDIGKNYYAKLGWLPFASKHVSLPPASPPVTNGVNGHKAEGARPIYAEDLEALCELDEKYIRAEVAHRARVTNKPAVAVVPDYLTMTWHHLRQKFTTSKLFPNKPSPTIYGAISTGPPGSRIWIIFTRVFYSPLAKPDAGNTLYGLRLVVEDEHDSEENAKKLKSVLEIAQAEAKEWQLGEVSIWNPSETVKSLLKKTGLDYTEVDREKESIASLMWYGSGKGDAENVEWVGIEKFSWC